MAIDTQTIPLINEGDVLGIVGKDTDRVHVTVSRSRLDRMDPWQFAEAMALTERRLGHAGVIEECRLIALPEPAVEPHVSE